MKRDPLYEMIEQEKEFMFWARDSQANENDLEFLKKRFPEITPKRYEEYYRHCIRFRIVCLVRLTEYDFHPSYWQYHYGNAPIYGHKRDAFTRIWHWYARNRVAEQLIRDLKIPTKEEYDAGKRIDLSGVEGEIVYDRFSKD